MDNAESLLIEEDYYSFLNVSKTATGEEINNAYRRLSLMYHPDKHTDPEKKKWAEGIFNKTKKAYEILSDPHQRAIYDTLGMRGLETEGWEVVPRTKTPLEIREEYERLAREREERMLLRNTNPRGTTTVNINATDLFNRYDDEYEEEIESGFPTIEVSAISANYSVEAPITTSDTVFLGCNIATQNGNGSGSINVAARKVTSDKGWAELDVGIGNGPLTSIKVFRALTKKIFFTGIGGLQFSQHGIRPSFVSTLAAQLNTHSVGYLTYKAGANSSMTTTLLHDCERFHCNLSFQLGVPHSFISFSYTHKMMENELKLRGALKFGTFGALAEYGAEKKISRHTSLSGAVTVGVPTGVILKLKVTRGSQTFVFPIHLCEDPLLAPTFYATLVPMVSWLIIKKLIIDPINKSESDKKREQAISQNKSRILEMKKEAKWAVELMQEMYHRITAEETRTNGLIIVNAVYGKLPAGVEHHVLEDDSPESEVSSTHNWEVINVTVPVQCLVKNSTLVLQTSSKSQLPGFFDVCIGESKHLTVKYKFRDQELVRTIKDSEPLTIPA